MSRLRVPRVMSPSPFQRYLRELLRRTAVPHQDFARAIGYAPNRFSQLLNLEPAPPVAPVICYRIAEFARVPPFEVLAAAGHDELVEHIRRTSGDNRPLVSQWLDVLQPAEQTAVLTLIEIAAFGATNRAERNRLVHGHAAQSDKKVR